MKNLIFIIGCCLTILPSNFVWGNIEITLTNTEHEHVSTCFNALLLGSEVGYVLYGAKPICVNSCSLCAENALFYMKHLQNGQIGQGAIILRGLKLPETSNYLMILQDFKNEQNPLILFINKLAFEEVFNNNISLFQYGLGPTLTANELLEEFKKRDFYTILKGNNVLIGLLLGFGLENSLVVGRKEKIQKILNCSQAHAIQNSSTKNSLTKLIDLNSKISVGYSSFEEEYNDLESQIVDASTKLTEDAPQLIFGRINNNSKITNALIDDYEKVQLKIQDILNQENWLTEALSKFYGESVSIKIIKDDYRKKNIQDKLVTRLAEFFLNDSSGQNRSITAEDFNHFIEGMKAADKNREAHYIASFRDYLIDSYKPDNYFFLEGFKTWSFFKFNKDEFSLSELILELNKLRNADSSNSKTIDYNFMQSFQNQISKNIENHESTLALLQFIQLEENPDLNLQSFHKNFLYYLPMKVGNGASVSDTDVIDISYNLKTLYGNVAQSKRKHVQLDLKRTFKGFREGFSKMKVGESGILYIHPEWGFKGYYNPPFITTFLIAEFEIHEILQKQ